MIIYPIEISQTSSSGAWSFNTEKIKAGTLKQIYIKSATATTTFDFQITDDKSNVVFDTSQDGSTATGILNILLELPLRGKYTIAVASASADEAFTGRLMVEDA